MKETPSILIVDSNPGFAMMLKESLEQDDDFQATVAHAGDEALALASENTFDLAIVDMGIDAVDDLDGEAVARELRKEQADLRLMLIPLKGNVLSEDLGDLEIQGVLPKPFFLPDLPELLDAALTKPLRGLEEPVAVSRPADEEKEQEVVVEAADTSRAGSAPVNRELRILAREVNADAVLLTREDDILSSVGRLSDEGLETLAHVVSQSCRLSAQAARTLGREQQRFEQNVVGDEHMLYAVTIIEDILLSVIVPPDVTLGFLRHQARATMKRLRDLLAGA